MRITEIINEEINSDILDPRFKHKQKFGDYTLVASSTEAKGKPKLKIIGFYDDKRVAEVTFDVNLADDALVSDVTWIMKAHRGKGLASMIYAYAKMLGNDIAPSPEQTDMGKGMWDAWYKSGEAEHLVPKGFKRPDPTD
jgi:hypothetical protein